MRYNVLFRKIANSVMKPIRFYKDERLYLGLHDGESAFETVERKRCLYDDNDEAGSVDPHYFLQDLYFAKKIINTRENRHFDIGSRVDGFITHLLSAGINVTLIDIRPFSVQVEGLSFIHADATSLNGIEDNSLESVSSLHAIEHFGLGRYGDKIEPDAWKKSLDSIQKKLKPGGKFYLSVPIARNDTLIFNAHRMFSPETIVSTLNTLSLESFSYIHDYKVFDVPIEEMDHCKLFVHDYDCGLFCFEKKINDEPKCEGI